VEVLLEPEHEVLVDGSDMVDNEHVVRLASSRTDHSTILHALLLRALNYRVSNRQASQKNPRFGFMRKTNLGFVDELVNAPPGLISALPSSLYRISQYVISVTSQ